MIEQILSVCLGVGLGAACGFRVFIPLLLINLAARTGHLTLSGNFEWLGGNPALITLLVASLLEVAAYYVPWLDNLLDVIAGPAAAIAGTVATASVLVGLDPYLKWTLAVIAGGGLAGALQVVTTGLRQASSLATGGLGNPVVSSLELGGAVGLSIISILVPVAAAVCIALLCVVLARRLWRYRTA
ncbi:MAG: DUF4126 domain-containing protein [Thermoanaerobaculia bacterium]